MTIPARLRALSLAASLLALFAGPVLAESTFDEEMRLLEDGMRLAPGSVVADLGAGKGPYSVGLAERVGPDGTVFATEIDPERLDTLRALKEDEGLSQLEVVEGAFDGTGLAPASVDAALLRDVYPHVTAPEPFAKSIFETIRPGGRLVVVDFPPTIWLALWTPEGIPENRGGHGIRRELLVSELEAVGFRSVETIDVWPSSNFITKTYAVVFERP